MRWTVVGQILLAGFAGAAYASDGVIEINQIKALAGGVDACDTPGFPISICKSGSYRLTSNLDAGRGESAIELNTANVAIDLGGMIISGSSACLIGPSGWVISCTTHRADGISGPNAAGVSVRNGAIAGFDNCVALGDGARVSDLAVAGCNGSGLSLSGESSVDHVAARSNLVDGIYCAGRVRLSDVVAAHNGVMGVQADGGGMLQSVSADNNGYAGIWLPASGTLSDFSSHRNGANGAQVAAGALVSSGSLSDNGVADASAYALGTYPGAGFRALVISSVNGGNTAKVDGGGVNLGGNTCNGGAC